MKIAWFTYNHCAYIAKKDEVGWDMIVTTTSPEDDALRELRENEKIQSWIGYQIPDQCTELCIIQQAMEEVATFLKSC